MSVILSIAHWFLQAGIYVIIISFVISLFLNKFKNGIYQFIAAIGLLWTIDLFLTFFFSLK